MKKIGLPGVYIIQNTNNSKVYIGASKDTYNRLCMHKTQLRANKHHNTHLQTAFNLYGENSFTFDVLEDCDEEFIYSQENYWCILMNSHNRKFGYNQDSTGPNGKCGVSNQTKLKMSKSANKKRLVVYTIYGQYYKDFSDLYKCAEDLNAFPENVYRKKNVLFKKKNLIDSKISKYIITDLDININEVESYWKNVFDQIRNCKGKYTVSDCFGNYIGKACSRDLANILNVSIGCITVSVARGTYLKTLKIERCR
jgi:group I intron endonuclease